IEPLLLPYIALMFGSAVAGLFAAWNAVVIRRFGLALLSLLLGLVAWFACVVMVFAANKAHVRVVFLLLGARVLHFLVGGLLFLLQRPHVHGSEFLHGRLAPMRASYVATLAAAWFIPLRLLLILLGVPPGRG
ncbi:MAG TPA: hypothetical protein VJ276_22960, partial [Thermoanaerobaculia bacterium]|nr:hypothetical protein [Thermoanaerobaculia bacterium]